MTVELNYQTYGEGEPVFILHGLFGSGRNWSSIARQLANTYSVITVDLRNHGTSGHATTMSYPEMAEDVIALARQLSIEKFNIVGHSMGGKTAMVMSLLYPENINKLIVIDIAPVSYPTNHEELIEAMLSLAVDKIENRNHADVLLSAEVPDPNLRQFLLQNLVKDDDRYAWRINLEAIRENHATLRQFPEEVNSLTFNGPALFLSGSLSDYVKTQHQEAIAGFFPQYKPVVVNDANHWVHADKPDIVLEELKGFLAGN